jgi:hypothetical protein
MRYDEICDAGGVAEIQYRSINFGDGAVACNRDDTLVFRGQKIFAD